MYKTINENSNIKWIQIVTEKREYEFGTDDYPSIDYEDENIICIIQYESKERKKETYRDIFFKKYIERIRMELE